MAPSMTYLCQYLESHNYKHISKGFIYRKGVTLSTVVCYVIKFCSNDTSSSLIDTIRRLNDMALRLNNIVHVNLLNSDPQISEFKELLSNSLVPEVKKFFAVPKLKQLEEDENGNEDYGLVVILAAFIHFLIQILTSGGDRTPYSLERFEYDRLKKEMVFLLTIFGDVPFHHIHELHQVIVVNNNLNLWDEFESLTNRAGAFIYNSVLVAHPVTKSQQLFEEEVPSLLEECEMLKSKIKDYCIFFAGLNLETKTGSIPADSVLNVDTLLEDLENLRHSSRAELDLSDDVHDQITTLQNELIFVRSFLLEEVYSDDAFLSHQDLGSTNYDAECLVLQIRDVSYEAKYLINSLVVGNIPMWYLTLRLHHNIIQKFEIIRSGIGKIKKIKMMYDAQIVLRLAAEDFCRDGDVSASIMQTPAAVANDDVIVGFEHETMKILDVLLGDSKKLQIISICGMPGLGKTTMAKKLYNHRLVNHQFDKHAWIVASQKYSRRSMLIEMMTSLVGTGNLLDNNDETLALEIHKCLKGRRYLIVMDDVWSQNVWYELRRCFPNDENRSRIIVTSRITDAAPLGSIIHKPPFLSEDQCWQLLQQKVFQEQYCPQELHDLGRRIAMKCNGLPLAVVVIAGVLTRRANDKSLWEEVDNNLHLYISTDEFSNCRKILELSYNHLPCRLKLCYLYFGMFPEDTEISTKKLKGLWISEGLIPKDKKKSQEQVAQEYLKDLIGRSLVLVGKNTSTGGIKTCHIHDLLHDLCIQKAEEENFMKIVKENDVWSVNQKHQRLCIQSKSENNYTIRPFGFHCRSLIGNDLSGPAFDVSQMKRLRTLEFHAHYLITDGPRRVDELLHLRYLTLTGTLRWPGITTAVFKHVNLEVFRVDLHVQISMPVQILNMRKLRHLHVRPTVRFTEMNNATSLELNNHLRKLSCVKILNNMDEKVLRCTPHLRKLKCECYDDNIFPDFSFLTKLESFNLHFNFGVHQNFTENKFWPLTLRKLTLYGCSLAWEEMSVIIGRLSKLEVLKLEGGTLAGKKWETREGGFQELKFLKIYWSHFEQWIVASSDHFPKLNRLVLHGCNKLRNLPIELGEIPTLKTIEVRNCRLPEVYLYALKIEKQQKEEYGNEDLNIILSSNRFSMQELQIVYDKWVQAEDGEIESYKEK